MGEVITLSLDDGARAVVLEETSGVRWFACVFVDARNGESLPLGAENREYLLSRLRTVLDESEDVVGTIDGRPVRWILSLAEQHVSIYVNADGAPGRTLFVQDSRGEVLRKAELHPADIRIWRASLQSL
ncbi:MAG TPA: hypothetical protein VF911_00935 [Thermoanaerobaculia bacterium]